MGADGQEPPDITDLLLVRHLLGRRSEDGLLAGAARERAHLFPLLLAVIATARPGSMLPFNLLSATLTQLGHPLPG